MKNSLNNPLETESINRLILRFSVPSVIGMLVNALYNIIDQIFIGHGVGLIGTATTNVAFPITTICTAISMLFGIGGASNLNLFLGKKEKEKAMSITGNAFSLMIIISISLTIIIFCFINPILYLFGTTEELYESSRAYISIISIGIPFLIISSAGSQIIRADGSPIYSMFCMIMGAILNTLLDPLFIFGFNAGIKGAAYATVISQIVSCTMVVLYIPKCKSLKLSLHHFILKIDNIKNIIALGAGASLNQICITVFQIILNNSLAYYGALSVYGSEIPLACVGVITKLNTILIALISGTSQGCQPIYSQNYGAKKFKRVYKTLYKVLGLVIIIGLVAEICFQLFPREIISIFGKGNEEYFQFAEMYLRIFMLMTFINGIQPVVGNFLSSIGSAKKAIFVILVKQIVFLIPLLIILPKIYGINGIVYAGPITDIATAILMIFFLKNEIRKIKEKEVTL